MPNSYSMYIVPNLLLSKILYWPCSSNYVMDNCIRYYYCMRTRSGVVVVWLHLSSTCCPFSMLRHPCPIPADRVLSTYFYCDAAYGTHKDIINSDITIVYSLNDVICVSYWEGKQRESERERASERKRRKCFIVLKMACPNRKPWYTLKLWVQVNKLKGSDRVHNNIISRH